MGAKDQDILMKLNEQCIIIFEDAYEKNNIETQYKSTLFKKVFTALFIAAGSGKETAQICVTEVDVTLSRDKDRESG